MAILRHFVRHARPPTVAEVSNRLEISVEEARACLHRLDEQHAVTLSPGTSYISMANPFSAIPTPFHVHAGEQTWWGNCIWDGLGILAMLDTDGHVDTFCPDCGEEMDVFIADGELVEDSGLVHFSVPARHWWDVFGYT